MTISIHIHGTTIPLFTIISIKTIIMASENTDGIDSNGDLSISGATINVTGGSGAFDYDGTATYTGGTIIIKCGYLFIKTTL